MTPRRKFRWIPIVGIAALLAGAGIGAPPGAAQTAAPRAQDAYVLVSGDAGQVRAAIQAAGGAERFALGDGTIAARVPTARLATLTSARGVSHIFPDDAITFGSGSDTNVASAPEAGQAFQEGVHAPEVWASGIDGSKAAVAVIDTGINQRPSSKTKILAAPFGAADTIGHGTFVAGLIAGNDDSGFKGIAPDTGLVSISVVAPDGSAHTSDLIRGIDWAVQNRTRYNIRVINISATTSMQSSYLTSLLDAAVERAWFSGIVVVVSAGNNGASDEAISVAPANDPFVITVGALDDAGTAKWGDDTLAPWSGRGTTLDGIAKPDVVAPGRHLISWLANGNPLLARQLPNNIVDRTYIRLSGTSASAPVVAGVVALMLDKNPSLTPDQVKAILKGTADPLPGSAAPRVDAEGAVFSRPTASANVGQPINFLLAAATGKFDLKQAGNVSSREPAKPRSLPAGALTWDPVKLQSITWDSITWDSITWDSITWDSITWDAVHFDVMEND